MKKIVLAIVILFAIGLVWYHTKSFYQSRPEHDIVKEIRLHQFIDNQELEMGHMDTEICNHNEETKEYWALVFNSRENDGVKLEMVIEIDPDGEMIALMGYICSERNRTKYWYYLKDDKYQDAELKEVLIRFLNVRMKYRNNDGMKKKSGNTAHEQNTKMTPLVMKVEKYKEGFIKKISLYEHMEKKGMKKSQKIKFTNKIIIRISPESIILIRFEMFSTGPKEEMV